MGSMRRRISCGGRHLDIVFGEIDAGFEQRDQLQQMLLHRLKPPRDRTFGLPRGDARLIQRGGFDQIAHAFGLRQIDAAVEIGAQSELAGLGQAGSGRAGALQSIAQHGGRAVTGDLDHVFSGVGLGRGEEGHDHRSTVGLRSGSWARVAVRAFHRCRAKTGGFARRFRGLPGPRAGRRRARLAPAGWKRRR